MTACARQRTNDGRKNRHREVEAIQVHNVQWFVHCALRRANDGRKNHHWKVGAIQIHNVQQLVHNPAICRPATATTVPGCMVAPPQTTFGAKMESTGAMQNLPMTAAMVEAPPLVEATAAVLEAGRVQSHEPVERR